MALLLVAGDSVLQKCECIIAHTVINQRKQDILTINGKLSPATLSVGCLFGPLVSGMAAGLLVVLVASLTVGRLEGILEGSSMSFALGESVGLNCERYIKSN